MEKHTLRYEACKHIFWALVFLVITGMIFYLASVPSLGSQIENRVLNQVLRKTGHVAVYFMLTGSLWKSLQEKFPDLQQRAWLTIVACLTVAILDELFQSRVPGRHGNSVGFLFDAIGIGVWVLFATQRHRKKPIAVD